MSAKSMLNSAGAMGVSLQTLWAAGLTPELLALILTNEACVFNDVAFATDDLTITNNVRRRARPAGHKALYANHQHRRARVHNAHTANRD